MNQPSRLLHIEDDPGITGLVEKLTPTGVIYDVAPSVEAAKKLLDAHTYNVILLDIYLGSQTGFEIIDYLKVKEFSQIPAILVLTGSQDEQVEVRCHELDVQEFIRKPFKAGVLKAQIEKHLVKSIECGQKLRQVGPLQIDENKMQVKLISDAGEETVLLTLKEYRLLLKFIHKRNQTVTREEILVDVWKSHSEIQSRTIDMHVSALRKKLGPVGDSITSVRGVGYSLKL